MFKSVIIGFIMQIFGMGITFSSQIVFVKLLGAEEFGKINYYLSFSNILLLFTLFGIQFYLPKKIYLETDKKAFFSNIFYIVTLGFIVISIISILILRGKISIITMILILLTTYGLLIIELLSGYYIGIHKLEISAIIRNIISKIGILVIFLLLYFTYDRDYKIYFIAFIITNLIIGCIFILPKLRKVNIDFKILNETKYFYFLFLTYGLYGHFSKILQKKYSNFEDVGILSFSIMIGGLMLLVGSNFSKALMPRISKAWNESNRLEIDRLFKISSKITTYIMLPLCIFLILNSKELLKLLSNDFSNRSIIFSIIIMGQFVNSFMGTNGTILNMTGNEKYELLNGVLRLVLGLILGVFLGKRYFYGIALSLALIEIITNILKYYQVKKLVGVVPYTKKTLSYIGIILIVEIIIFTIIKSYTNSLLSLFLLNGLIIPIMIVCNFYFSSKEDKNQIILISNKIKDIIKLN